MLLAGCSRGTDTMAPLIGITEPKGGVVAKGKSVSVAGYALDDVGLESIVVKVGKSKTEVLPRTEHGERLASFRFRLEAPRSGQVEVVVTATDKSRQSRSYTLPLVLDASPPRIEVGSVDYIKRGEGENQKTVIQVSGRALDDTGVDRVVLQYGNSYSPLSLPKGKEVPFFIELPSSRALMIVVDAAGNRSSRWLPK